MPSICPICGQMHRSQEEVEADEKAAKDEDSTYVPKRRKNRV
jgi:uncharacterized Zn finger protein (UPF0148 family)